MIKPPEYGMSPTFLAEIPFQAYLHPTLSLFWKATIILSAVYPGARELQEMS